MDIKQGIKTVFFLTFLLLVLLPGVYASAAELEIYDDEEGFWAAGVGGGGSLGIDDGIELVTFTSGSSSHRFEAITGSYSYVNIQHGYPVAQDWSGYDNLVFYWYGQNTGTSFTVKLESPTHTDRFSTAFVDDFSGWQEIVLPFSGFTVDGSADLSTVKKISISYSGTARTNWYLDKVSIATQKFELNTNVQGDGSIIRDPDASNYDDGTTVELTATPGSGWEFSEWGGDLSGNTNPNTIEMNDNKVVTAVFSSIAIVQASTSSPQYLRDSNMIMRVRDGTPNGIILMQVNIGGTLTWFDQRTLDSQGDLDLSIRVPSSWDLGTYTLYVKDHESGSSDSTTFSIVAPSPPPPPPRSGGGGVASLIPSVFVIERVSATEAAKLLEDFEADEVADTLRQLEDINHVVNILENFDPDYALDVIKNLPPDLGGIILHLLEQETAIEVLLNFNVTEKETLEQMISHNISNSILLIEYSIKNKTAQLNESARKETLQKLSQSLASLDSDMLIDILISISRLPETPSTVSYLFEAMNQSRTIELIELWTSETYSDALLDLVNVLESMSLDLLANIYRDINENSRTILVQALPLDLLYALPPITQYEISDLEISPLNIMTGETITFKLRITNNGNKTDLFNFSVTLNELRFAQEEGIMSPGESQVFEYYVSVDDPGEYIINVGENSVSFQADEETIIEPPGPEPVLDFIVTSIEVTPETSYPGELLVLVNIDNQGQLSGSGNIKVYLDDDEIRSSEVTISAGGSIVHVFSIIEEEIGTHTLTSGNIEVNFEIMQEPSRFPWSTVIVIVIILIVAAYYVYSGELKLDLFVNLRDR